MYVRKIGNYLIEKYSVWMQSFKYNAFLSAFFMCFCLYFAHTVMGLVTNYTLLLRLDKAAMCNYFNLYTYV